MLMALQILDGPRFWWRGVLLDVGRHFFPVPFIKKFLDVMALHKCNVFHWHLTEDQVRTADVLNAFRYHGNKPGTSLCHWGP